MIKTDAATIKLPKTAIKKGVVILNLDEYWELAKNAVPTFYLKGRKAKELDKLVEEGLKAHREGKTRRLRSLSDLR